MSLTLKPIDMTSLMAILWNFPFILLDLHLSNNILDAFCHFDKPGLTLFIKPSSISTIMYNLIIDSRVCLFTYDSYYILTSLSSKLNAHSIYSVLVILNSYIISNISLILM